MEENANLLEEFVHRETEKTIYEKRYRVIRKLSILFSVYAPFSYVMTMSLLIRNRWDFSQGGILLMGLCLIVMIVIIAALLALILAVFIDRKYSYLGRYKKSFWITLLGISGLYSISFSITGLYQVLEIMKSKL